MKSTKTMHSMTHWEQEFKTRELGLLQCWRTRFLDFLGSVRCAVGCFPIDFQGKVLEWVQLCIGKKYVKCDIQCHHIDAFMLHGSKWKQSGIFLEAFQDIMFQHLADQPFLPASQRVFRARSPEMALVRSTFKDWQKIRFGCLVFPAHSNRQEKYQAFQLLPSFTSNNSHLFGTVYYLYYLFQKFLQN